MNDVVPSRDIPRSVRFSRDRIDFGSRWRWTIRLSLCCAGLILFGAAAWGAAQQNDERWIFGALIAAVFACVTYRAARAPRSAGRLSIVREPAAAETASDDLSVLIIPCADVTAVEIHYQNVAADGVADGEYEIWIARRVGASPCPVFAVKHGYYGKLLRVAMQTADFCQAQLVFHRSSRKARKFHRPQCAWVFPLVFGPALVWGLWLAARQVSMLSWPETVAVIDQFEANEHPAGEYSWYANPTIRYRYSVNGKQYIGQRLNPSPLNYQRQGAFHEDTDDFKPGANVRCWYRERDPSVAYLVNRGVTTDVCLIVLVIVGFVVFGIWSRREQKRLPALVQAAEMQARAGSTTVSGLK